MDRVPRLNKKGGRKRRNMNKLEMTLAVIAAIAVSLSICYGVSALFLALFSHLLSLSEKYSQAIQLAPLVLMLATVLLLTVRKRRSK
jgi:hypothetical protein